MSFDIGLEQSGSESERSSVDRSFSRDRSRSKSFVDPRWRRQQMRLHSRFNRRFRGLDDMDGFHRYRKQTMSGMEGLANQARNFGGMLRQDYNQGMNRFSQFAQQQNPYLQEQINQFGEDMGRHYREQILPGIGSNAQLAGQRGSSRQGIAEYLAADANMNQYMRGVTDMRSRAYGQQQQAAQQWADMGLQGAQGMYGLAGDVMSRRGALANQFGQTQLAAQAQPFVIGAEVVGAPSVLSRSRSGGYSRTYGRSNQYSESEGSGFEFGF